MLQQDDLVAERLDNCLPVGLVLGGPGGVVVDQEDLGVQGSCPLIQIAAFCSSV